MKKRFLVTGSNGFLGSQLILALLNKGYIVRGFDARNNASTSQGLHNMGLESVKGDITNYEQLLPALKDVDAVVHLAAINGTKNFYERPIEVLDVGVKGIINLIEACKVQGVRELHLASSSEVYNTAKIIPTPENIPLSIPDPLNPRFSYAASKIISEMYVLHYGKDNQWFDRVTVVRPHNVYGPPNISSDHVIPDLIKKISNHPKDSDKFEFEGTIDSSRSFCYITDAIDGMMAVIEKGKHLEIYNVGNDVENLIFNIVDGLAGLLGKNVYCSDTGKSKEGSPTRRLPDITKLRSLGYSPKVSIAEGLRKTVDYWRTQSGK